MTDAEVICEFMEPKPTTPQPVGLYDESPGGWWTLHPDGWVPNCDSLDRLREVEARLTEEQWLRYVDALIDHMPEFPRKGEIIHASAEQKIAALAAVIRSNAEGARG
jgi:hypothetical protein